MNDGNGNAGQPMPLHLTQQQQDVIRALQSRENEEFPLSQWDLGALYALVNPYNPDRFSQAAQSLRELVEKLPDVMLEGDVQIDSYDLRENRRQIIVRIARDRQRYLDGWNGKSLRVRRSVTSTRCHPSGGANSMKGKWDTESAE